MGTLWAGKERRPQRGRSLRRWTDQQIDALAAQETHPLASLRAPTPVSPQERSGCRLRNCRLLGVCGFGMRAQDGTHPARLLGGCTVPLALFS